MASLLDELLDAHGGLARWNELESADAHLTQGGVTWALKGHSGELSDVFVTATLHQQRVSRKPFRDPDGHNCYTADRVSIERSDGTAVEMLDAPRAATVCWV